MKKLVTLMIIGLFATSAMAAAEGPIDKGSMMLGGSIYFQSQSGDLYEYSDGEGGTESPSSFGFMPSIGYFVAPSILVGADVEFSQWKVGDYKETFFGIGPMVGYYFNLDKEATEAKGTIIPFVNAFFKYGKFKAEEGDSEFKTTETSFGARGGIIYMISNAVGANVGIQFSSDKVKVDDYEGPGDDSVSGTTIEFGAGITSFIF